MFKYSILSIALLLMISGCQEQMKPLDLPIAIVPQVQTLERKTGHFKLEAATTIVLPNEAKEWQWVVQSLNQRIQTTTGFQPKIAQQRGTSSISFEQNDSFEAAGAYQLIIDPYEIIIRSKDAEGAFYAVQTLFQLMPTAIFAQKKQEKTTWAIPAVDIKDAPRFAYRGMHLDVSRHFFPVKAVKEYIDLLAIHKLNYFHWHLTDDQGWRVEIKKYPKLTEVSAFRNGTLIGHYNDEPQKYDGQRYGGFYTQEEIRAVVEYAKERFITVVPEIELPGHSQAVLAAYPELACSPGPYEVLQKWGISDHLFCPTETTFEFLENVLTEVIDLFPGPYIHIGGDECPKRSWEESAFCQDLIRKEGLKGEAGLQSYFIRRIEQFVNSKGRKMIGWDEILDGGLAPNATVMSWRGIKGGIEAAQQGHDVVMTPTTNCYFDYYQSDHPEEPLAIGGFLPLQTVYEYEPIPEALNEAEARHILGVQGNVWSEYMPTFDQVTYMAYPRACALAEVAWSSKSGKDFSNFIDRLIPHLTRFEAMNVRTANHLFELKSNIQTRDGKVIVELSTLAKRAKIRYTLDGSEPNLNSPLYEQAITIQENRTLRAQAYDGQKAVGRGWKQDFDWHLAAGASIELDKDPHPKYKGGGNACLVNGVTGSNDRYGDAEWLGFDGKDFRGLIDLETTKVVKKAQLRLFKGEGQWIYLPRKISIAISDDGKIFETIATTDQISGDNKAVELMLPLGAKRGRYLEVKMERFGMIPEGRQGAGHEAWLFVDEIKVY